MSDRKRYKNERRQAALQKREGTREYGLPDPPKRDPQANKARFTQRKSEEQQRKESQTRWTKKPPSPQTVRPKESFEPPPPDHKMHIKSLPEDRPVRTYRVEVQSFNSGFSHTNVHKDGSRVDLYTPGKPTDVKSWYKETHDKRGNASYSSAVGKGKKTPRKDDPWFNDKFLSSRKGQPSGNRTFYNFGEPERALHFYDQKSRNPTEIARGNVFKIKSFEVPHEVFQRVAKDSVHEKDALKFPNAPINVDRRAPNQFGLPQAYSSLLEERQIKGSAREENPEALRRQFKQPPRKQSAPNKHWASKGVERREMLHEAQTARERGGSHKVAEVEEQRSVGRTFTLADFMTPKQKQTLGIKH